MTALAARRNDGDWQLLDAWCRSLKDRNLSRKTLVHYRRTVGVFLAWTADHRLTVAEVTHRDIGRWLAERPRTAKTRSVYTSALAAFYRWCLREEHLATDPTIRVDRPKLRRYLPRPAPLELVMRAIDDAEPRVSLMLACGAFAGMRISEIAALRVEDLLLAHDPPMVLLHGKGDKERLVPLHDEILTALHNYGIPKSGWLFPSPGGEGITPCYVGRLITQATDDVGGHITPHQLRHLFGTSSYAVCNDLRVVQELMGHASPATTAVYAAFSPTVAAATVRALPSGR